MCQTPREVEVHVEEVGKRILADVVEAERQQESLAQAIRGKTRERAAAKAAGPSTGFSLLGFSKPKK